jgi:hypothetical protein
MRHQEHVYLDEAVYVVIGDSGRSATAQSAWPVPGTYGSIPKNGIVGSLEEMLDSLGPELWTAKRRGREICLIESCEHYSPATALLWAADCVEGFAKRIDGVDGNVAEALVLARRYATDHVFQAAQVQSLRDEIDKLLKQLQHGRAGAVATIVAGGTLEHELFGWNERELQSQGRADRHAKAHEWAVQVSLARAARALCGADPLESAREAARWCRDAAHKRGRDPEAPWQARELLKYLQASPDESMVALRQLVEQDRLD